MFIKDYPKDDVYIKNVEVFMNKFMTYTHKKKEKKKL